MVDAASAVSEQPHDTAAAVATWASCMDMPHLNILARSGHLDPEVDWSEV